MSNTFLEAAWLCTISLMTLCQEIICSRQEIRCGRQEKSKLIFRDSLEIRIGVWVILWKVFILDLTLPLPHPATICFIVLV